MRFSFLALICFWVCGGAVFSEIGGLPPMPSIRGMGADRGGALSDAISKAVAFYSGFYPVEGALPMGEVKASSFRVLREKKKEGAFSIEIQPLFSSKPRFLHTQMVYFPFEEPVNFKALISSNDMEFKGDLDGSYLRSMTVSEIGSVLRQTGFEVVGSGPRFLLALAGQVKLGSAFKRRVGRKSFSYQNLRAELSLRAFHVFDGEELGAVSLTRQAEISSSMLRSDLSRHVSGWVSELASMASKKFLLSAREIPPRVLYAQIPAPEKRKMDPLVKPEDDGVLGEDDGVLGVDDGVLGEDDGVLGVDDGNVMDSTRKSEAKGADDKMPDWLVLDDESTEESKLPQSKIHKKAWQGLKEKMLKMQVNSLQRQVKLLKASDLPWLKKVSKD
jgi:hypothetical protein